MSAAVIRRKSGGTDGGLHLNDVLSRRKAEDSVLSHDRIVTVPSSSGPVGLPLPVDGRDQLGPDCELSPAGLPAGSRTTPVITHLEAYLSANARYILAINDAPPERQGPRPGRFAPIVGAVTYPVRAACSVVVTGTRSL
jgi:hypothetical protein